MGEKILKKRKTDPPREADWDKMMKFREDLLVEDAILHAGEQIQDLYDNRRESLLVYPE